MALASLAKALPKPKYTGEDEDLPVHTQSRGPRIVGADTLDQTQIVLKAGRSIPSSNAPPHTAFAPSSGSQLTGLQRTGPPPYGQRVGWRPRNPADYGDGGAFPEIPVAQYPLDMGRKSTSSSNALAIQVDAEGKVKYDAIARRGHSENRIIHSSFRDLIPLRQRADVGEISLERPSEEEVEAAKERTKMALEKLVNGAVAAQKPKNVKTGRGEATFVRYTRKLAPFDLLVRQAHQAAQIVRRRRC